MLVHHMEYVDYSSESDQVEVQDESGNIVAILKGNQDLNVVATFKVGWISGLLVPVLNTQGNLNMPTGRLMVYLK